MCACDVWLATHISSTDDTLKEEAELQKCDKVAKRTTREIKNTEAKTSRVHVTSRHSAPGPGELLYVCRD